MTSSFRLATDENVEIGFNRALSLILPELDIVRVVDVGLRSSPDPEILEWAAEENRIILTHDVATMKDYAWKRVGAGLAMPGLFIIRATIAIGPAIDELELILRCSEPQDWRNQVNYIPIGP